MPKNPAIDNDPKVKAARKDHAAGIWDGNVDKEGEAIVFVKGKPYTVTNKYESIEESVGKAVNGLNDLGNKMKGRDQKDIRRIEKLYRSGNKKVFQGAIRALDTDLRDQVKDIFDALGMVKQGVIESVDLDESSEAWVLVQNRKIIKKFKTKPSNSAFTSSDNQTLMTVSKAAKMGIKESVDEAALTDKEGY